MAKKTILVITDGIGHNSSCDFNAFCNANTPTYDYLFKNVPYSFIKTYGLSVGLPEGQMGNSEVGHITIGSGRVLFQDLVRISQAIKNGQIETFNTINPGEGFWVYSGSANTMNLETPPSIGFAYEMLNKLNAVPLANADVYVNGTKIATTDASGKFLLDNVSDGSTVIIKKNGYAVAYGVVKNGKVVIITQKDNNQKVTFTATEGQQKVAKKGLSSQDGTVSLIASSAQLKKDITVSVIPFKSAANAPALNSVTVNNENVPVEQMAIIGGALINVEDSSGNLLTPDEVNGSISFNLAQTTILGDLDAILNGEDTTTAQTFAADAFTKFNETKYFI